MSDETTKKPMKCLIIFEDGSTEWTGFDDEYQQLGFIQLRLNQRAVQAVANQVAQEHARRQAEAKKIKKAEAQTS